VLLTLGPLASDTEIARQMQDHGQTMGREVIATTHTLARIRQHYTPDTKYLYRILLNATSVVEANIALDLLLKHVPERDLTVAVNLREAIKALPASPFSMAIDEQTLMRVANMEKHMAVFKKTLPDGYDLVVTTAGNLVLDLIVIHDGHKIFWTPVPIKGDYVTPELIDHLITSDHLFPEAVNLVQAMGLVFNPTLYLSLDDWHLEYAAETMAGLGELF